MLLLSEIVAVTDILSLLSECVSSLLAVISGMLCICMRVGMGISRYVIPCACVCVCMCVHVCVCVCVCVCV